MKKLNALILRH